MTSISPSVTKFFVKECALRAEASPTGASYALPIVPENGAVVISEDQDRDNWIEVRLTLDWLPQEIFDALDPRQNTPWAIAPVMFRVEECDVQGHVLSYWPGMLVATNSDNAWLWPWSIERDWVSRTVTLTLVSGELHISDEMRLANTNIDTGAADVRALVNYALAATFTSASLTSYAPVMASTLLPAGSRRLWQPGQTALELIKTELDAIDCRIYDYYGRAWVGDVRNATYGPSVRLATMPGLMVDADPIVWGLTESRTRDNDWADGVIIRYDLSAYGGSFSWQFTPESSTKGILITRERPVPASNAAAPIRQRSLIRGSSFDVTARARLDVRTRTTAAIWTQDALIQGSIRATEHILPEGEMRLRIQS